MENNNHKVLALKYRPKNFDELIGQDVLVETIKNSITSKNLPNAYLLSGIRGVGKTTTARLIAQAINCKKDFLKKEKCAAGEYCSCKAISEFKNLDVLEIDGAQHTGVDSTKELIASCMYAPTTAKYKVIIADEFQMLSKSSFAALLKTLEEPPPHLKFVFCTTEVRKIPVTIISRCQRFDLHRVSIRDLVANLKKISKIENGKISDGALTLIAKAAEGSVRDSLSLLDRALISQKVEKKEIEENFIRKMLGIADKSKLLYLLNFIFQGDQKKSIELLRETINEGIEPKNLINDLLEMIYFIQQKSSVGNFESDLTISETESEIIDSISKSVNSSTLILFWQFLLKGLDELSIVANPILSLEMLVIKLLHLKNMPSYEELIKNISNEQTEEKSLTAEKIANKVLNDDNEINKISKDQIKNTTQTKPELSSLKLEETNNENIKSFEDLIKLSSNKKEVELKYDLERNVNLVKFSDGKIDIAFNENLRKNFVRNLSEKLLEWTGKRWIITLTKETGQKTFSELQSLKRKDLLDKEKKGEVYKKFKDIFSDADLLEVLKKD
tara:strand:+ start:154 stop:1827 length:1674 start_codon:yes stop_codon:yes gene_type:complete